MDMAELAIRTGIPVRKLRYVFDHRVLPGLRDTPVGQGVARTFTEFEGFGIALSATLLDAGVSRKTVVAAIDASCRPIRPSRRPDDIPLYRAFIAGSGRLEIGDGRHLRVRTPERRGVADALDTDWIPLQSGPSSGDDYTPVVTTIVDLAGLARAVHGRP